MDLLQRFFPIILILRLSLMAALAPAPARSVVPPCAGDLSLSGVTLSVCTFFLSDPEYIPPDPASGAQMAYAFDRADPNKELSITAVPFGIKAGSELFPAVDANSDPAALAALLSAYRQGQGGQPQPGPAAVFFGQTVKSSTSQVNLPGVDSRQAARLTEWVFTAGGRLWIVRTIQYLTPLEALFPSGSPAISLTITSPTLDHPTANPALAATIQKIYLPFAMVPPTPPKPPNPDPNLPAPSWWKGTCDNGHYQWDPYMNPYRYTAYPLGTSYRNVPACGPRSSYYEGPDVMIYFYDGAFPAYEWECVELSLRFMYLAYKVPPYPANGNGILMNYSGSRLDKISNGTKGTAPAPGDVLSLCSYCIYGHTSVVIDSNVDKSGNGTVTAMEQNNSYNGKAVLTVSNWVVFGNIGNVIGWLHPHPTPPTPVPTLTPTATPIPTPTITPIPPTPDPSQTNKSYLPHIQVQ